MDIKEGDWYANEEERMKYKEVAKNDLLEFIKMGARKAKEIEKERKV